jgi:hypothetical protein
VSARRPLEERFWPKVRVIDDDNSCWEWTGARTDRGYGAVKAAGRCLHSHRIAYELTHGPIPAGLLVRHRCDNKGCCRPSHLELGTVADNSRDMVARRRGSKGDKGLPYGVSPSRSHWRAGVKTGNHFKHLGVFNTIEEAAVVAERERVRLYGLAPETTKGEA